MRQNNILPKIMAQGRKGARRKVVAGLACAVVFCTTYALIRPAITLENPEAEFTCGLTVHDHTTACYYQELTCTQEKNHTHSESCYESPKVLTCGQEESGEHSHSEACYDQESRLVCQKAENHTHTEDCYKQVLTCTTAEHQHNESCVKSADEDNSADAALAELLELNDSGIPASIPITDNYTIYPGSAKDNVWTAYDGTWSETDSTGNATTKVTVTLPQGVAAKENHYLYITKITGDDVNAPSEDTVKTAAGHVADYQTYAIHWVEVYLYDSATFDQNTYTIDETSNIIKKNGTPVGVLCTATNNTQWVCIYDTESVLNTEAEATVEISYLNEKAYLKGDAQNRALQIFNFNDGDQQGGEREMHEVGTVTGISVKDNYYTGFTFTTSYAGPYVFVSKVLDADGYVSALTLRSIEDGFDPLDTDDVDGHDSSNNNKRVRTFDSIRYNLDATFAPRTSTASAPTINVYFEISLNKGVTEATFNPDAMTWLKSGDDYQIEYLNRDGKVIVIQDKNGNYYRDNDGDGVYTDPTYINAHATGSNHSNPYTVDTGIVQQRLSGVVTEKATDSNPNVLTSTKSYLAVVSVLNAKNGDTFTPTFRMWVEGNEENFTQSSATAETKSTANVLTLGKDDAVTVTCAPLFDLQLTKDIYLAYNSWYDFTTGQEVKDKDLLEWLTTVGSLRENYGKSDPSKYTTKDRLDKDGNPVDISNLKPPQPAQLANIRYGQMNTLSLALHLANESGSRKGMKGVSLPVGDITFDLQLSAEASQTSGGTLTPDELAEYYAILWDYNENVNNANMFTYEDGVEMQGETTLYRGNMNRNLYWDLIAESAFGVNAPFNYNGATNGGAVKPGYVYNGGTIKMTGVNGEEATETSADTANDSIYSFSLSGYDFDLDSWSFPTQNRGENYSGNIRAYGITQFCFFGGMAQVLNVCPYNQLETVNIKYDYKAGNLELTTASGAKLSTKGDVGKSVDWTNEVKGYSKEHYNQAEGGVTLYSPGNLSKHNWFGKKDSVESLDTMSRFNGIEWDAAAMAGDAISIIGRTQLSTTASSWIGASNYLQLYDSAGLSVRPKDNATPTTEDGKTYITNKQITVTRSYGSVDADYDDNQGKGTSTVLFAADPDYPSGYDTNRGSGSASGPDIMAYMNTVQEEDLVYSDKVYLDENGHYTQIWYDFNKNEIIDGDEMLTCVGFLVEQRGCKYKNYSYYTFPVTVATDEGLVGKTICTVNSLRAWAFDKLDASAMSGVTWLDGNWDGNNNSVNGYKTVTSNEANFNGWQMNNNMPPVPKPYTKAEYNMNGGLAAGHTNGEVYGNTLLILGYRAEVNIEAERKFTTIANNTSIKHTLSNIKTVPTPSSGLQLDKTDLHIRVELQARSFADDLYSKTEGYKSTDYAYISRGSLEITVGGQTYKIGTDKDSPVNVTYTVNDQTYTYQTYVEYGNDDTDMIVHLLGVEVGQTLPEIDFMVNLGRKLEDSSKVLVGADISGTGYNHAYKDITGMSSRVIGAIASPKGTQLTKDVDYTLIELNGGIKYTIAYTNDSSDSIATAYFYDLLPYNGDDSSRGTSTAEGAYSGLSRVDVALVDKEGNPVDRDENGTPPDQSGGGDTASQSEDDDPTAPDEGGETTEPTQAADTKVTLYFSMEDSKTLEDELKYFGGNDAGAGNENAINSWLPDANGDGKPDKSKSFALLGTLAADGSGLRRAQWIIDEYGDLNSENNWTCPVGKNYQSYEEAWNAYVTDYLSKVTCVFLKVENIAASNTVRLMLEMSTANNAAANIYGNTTWGWSPTGVGGVLQSTVVKTTVLSRTISGVVWHDKDLNGVLDSDESGIPDVTATLFVKGDNGNYELCETDVTGAPITTKTTDGNGAYSFEKLAPGEYVVAFSGTALENYNGATSYQVDGANNSNTNDGVALAETESSLDTQLLNLGLGDDYKYAIAYHLESDTQTRAAADGISMPLHSIPAILEDNIPLVNSVEKIDHQDLGLVISGPVLPETGGSGTILYTAGGLLLIGTGLFLLYKKKNREKEDAASS